jgi:hypothetical protein
VCREGEIDNVDDYVAREGARWALLAAEVLENDNQIVAKLEAPGLNANDFDIRVLNDMLIVSGKSTWNEKKRGGDFTSWSAPTAVSNGPSHCPPARMDRVRTPNTATASCASLCQRQNPARSNVF